MKKLLLLLTVCLFTFTGCKKDEDKEPTLKNTKWEEVDGSITKTYEFITDKDCRSTIKSDALDKATTASYTYVYDKPNVYFTAIDSDKADLKGIISENTMTIINTSTDKNIATLTKVE